MLPNSIKTILLATLALMFVTSCGRKKEAPKAADCTVGLNTSSCAVPLKGRSLWNSQYTITEKSNVNPPTQDFVETINLVYDFDANPNQLGENRIRRYLTVTRPVKNGPPWSATIVEEGKILEVRSDSFDFQIENSSCETITRPQTETLYYLRESSGFVRTNSTPVEPRPVRRISGGGGIFGAIAGVMTGAIGAAMEGMIEAVIVGTFEALVPKGPNPYINLLQRPRQSLQPASLKQQSVSMNVGCIRGRNTFQPSVK